MSLTRVSYWAAASAVALPAVALAEGDGLSVEDVEVLHEQRAWPELLERAIEVRPSQRTGGWRRWVTEAAEKHLATAAEDAPALEALTRAEALLERYPFLEASGTFMLARAEIGRRAFPSCFSARFRASRCNEMLEAFVAKDSENRDLALWAGALVTRHFTTEWVAMPYFHRALATATPGAPGCDGDALRATLASALRLQHDGEEARRHIEMAREVAFGPCWEAVGAALLKVLPESEAMLANTCADFEAKGVLEGLRAKKCERVAP